MEYIDLIKQLNDSDKSRRIAAIVELSTLVRNGSITPPVNGNDVNNHIHTTYSFSPYSPSMAVWQGYMAGLKTVGIMDHDSIGGAEEFIEAADVIGIACTVGVECRVKMDKTPLNGRKINNPDQDSVAYVALHGIPHTQISTISAFFKPYREARNVRNRKMVNNINNILKPFNLLIDFDKDVIPLSMYHDGGSVTERHLLFAVSKKIIDKYGKGEKTVNFLTQALKLNISAKVTGYLNDVNNPYYEYDLLGALKSDMVSLFYINSTDESPDISDIIKLAKETGSILAYAYLGDVTASVTGDKKVQKFEDNYLDELFIVLKELNFNAITYMPSRNTKEQLAKVRENCDKYKLFQISGEDINTPRQSFICFAQRDPEYSNLYDAAWALIGHETAATENASNGFFTEKTIFEIPDLYERIQYFKKLVHGKFN
ncbi:MAG: polymerase-3 alpha subunit [Clostridia bacterium]|nr:polymerase-3 alpha subunit [Clostridia bacterium]